MTKYQVEFEKAHEKLDELANKLRERSGYMPTSTQR